MNKCVFFLLLLFSYLSFSQSAVYYCETTGIVGIAYKTDKHNATDVKKAALENCITKGGKIPKLVMYSHSNAGFGAVAIGVNSNGEKVFGISAASTDLEMAKKIAIKVCTIRGGLNPIITDTWGDSEVILAEKN